MPHYSSEFKLCLDESLLLLKSVVLMLSICTDKASPENVLMVLSVSLDAECKDLLAHRGASGLSVPLCLIVMLT